LKAINFISTESLQKSSGGWSGNNLNIYNRIKHQFNTNYIGPVNPSIPVVENIVSKSQKVLGLKRNLAFFSHKRLTSVRNIVRTQLNNQCSYNFFWGQMPWLYCDFEQPYGVYLDTNIRTYLNVFLPHERFRENEIRRVEILEEKWLSNASHIFWGSDWAKHEASKTLQINCCNQQTVWVGGNIDIPEKDYYNDGYNFLFISQRFKEKGGFIAVEAFEKVKRQFPESTITIVGESPPHDILKKPGIVYAGFLNKNSADDLKLFQTILANAFCLVHPTQMDTLGQVIIEAGYYGCPSIAPNCFGIPELIKHNQTGLILQIPFSKDSVAQAMLKLIKDKNTYLTIRLAAREHTTTILNYDTIVSNMYKAICQE
jgi:glycosyltransferase involved in cell wall biosynthesis